MNDNKEDQSVVGSEVVLLAINESFQITDDAANQENAMIHHNHVVWQDDRHGNWDIYMFDLSTGSETRVTSDPHDQTNPRIFGDLIVWKDMRNNQGDIKNFPVDYNSDIYIYNFTTGDERPLTINDQFQYAPDIFGDKVIWLDYRSGRSEVIMYDLSTGQEFNISNNTGNCTMCRIVEDTIIWKAGINNSYHMFKYDILSQQVSIFNLKSSREINVFNFDNNHIVWSDVPYQDINSDIFLQNFSDDMVTQITTNESCQYGPMVADSWILWSDLRNDPDGLNCPCKAQPDEPIFDNWDIYMYKLGQENGKAQQLTSSTDSEFLSDVYENILVYIKNVQNRKDIYLMRYRD